MVYICIFVIKGVEVSGVFYAKTVCRSLIPGYSFRNLGWEPVIEK